MRGIAALRQYRDATIEKAMKYPEDPRVVVTALGFVVRVREDKLFEILLGPEAGAKGAVIGPDSDFYCRIESELNDTDAGRLLLEIEAKAANPKTEDEVTQGLGTTDTDVSQDD